MKKKQDMAAALISFNWNSGEKMKKYNDFDLKIHKEWMIYKQTIEKVLNCKELNLTKEERNALMDMFGDAIWSFYGGDGEIAQNMMEDLEKKYGEEKQLP